MSGQSYEVLGQQIGRLVQEKNVAYGSSFAKAPEILRVLFPAGVPPEQYVDVLLIARIVDKLFRVATSKDAFGESPYQDIAGYGILGASLTRGSSTSTSTSTSPVQADEEPF